jgi:predicted enzyme related to lactoylglutathione lyase
MHRSRLGTIVIDCDDIEAGSHFWAGVFGSGLKGICTDEDPYLALAEPVSGLRILLQRVPEKKNAKNRVHLDIETDDVEAEVRRIEALGGRGKTAFPNYWIMEDPCGNEFCVIPPETEGFPKWTREW